MIRYAVSAVIKSPVFIILLALFPDVSLCQKEWSRYTSGNCVNDIAIDGDIIWCATQDCLVRWNRRDMSYEILFDDDVFSITSFSALAVDHDGILWVGGETRRGWDSEQFIMSYDGQVWETHTTSVHSLKCIVVDHDNIKWFGSDNYGVFRYDGETWTNFTTENSFLNSNRIKDIAIDRNNVLWFGCHQGLTSFDGTVWKTYLETSDGSSLNVDTIAVDHDNVKWIGTSHNFIITCDESSWERFPESLRLKMKTGDVSLIFIDENNTKWIACPNGLFSITDTNSGDFQKYTIENGLEIHDINCMAMDDENHLWIGYPHVGLACFDGETWETFTLGEGPLGGSTRTIAVDRNNVKWIATSHVSGSYVISNGVSSFDGSEWNHYPFDRSMPQSAGKIMVDENNVKWISKNFSRSYEELGSEGNNIISAYNDTTWTYFRADDEYAFKKVAPDLVDKNGVEWYTDRYDGVKSFDGTSWTEYPELADDRIRAYTLAPDNSVWFGGRRLARYDGVSWTFISIDNIEDGRSLCPPLQLAVDYGGILWYGSNSCSGIEIIGLGMYDGKDWYIPDEFRYRAITDIAIDHDNTKWISSGVLLKMPDTRDVSVSENKGFPGADIRLSNNIPNPFNPSTTIQYSLPAPADVKLIVYSVSGQKIVTLVDACMPAGTHSAVFDGSNAASGLYFFRLEAGNTVRSGKMMLIR